MTRELFVDVKPTPLEAARIMAQIAVSLAKVRFSAAHESDLQVSIAGVLANGSIPYEREVKLGPHDRIDFLASGCVGVEIKVDGTANDVTRQLHRYAQDPHIECLLLVTTLKRHDCMPETMNGKPVTVLHLARSIF